MTTETQTFTTRTSALKKLLKALLLWFSRTLVLLMIVVFAWQSISPTNKIALFIIGLVLVGGIIAIPIYYFYSSFAAEEYIVTTDPATGMTVNRKNLRGGEQTTFYEWRNITKTAMSVGKFTSNGNTHREYTYYIFTSDGKRMMIPQSMENFDYFIEIVNRGATHLPYTWGNVDRQTAAAQGKEPGWHSTARNSTTF